MTMMMNINMNIQRLKDASDVPTKEADKQEQEQEQPIKLFLSHDILIINHSKMLEYCIP